MREVVRERARSMNQSNERDDTFPPKYVRIFHFNSTQIMFLQIAFSMELNLKLNFLASKKYIIYMKILLL